MLASNWNHLRSFVGKRVNIHLTDGSTVINVFLESAKKLSKSSSKKILTYKKCNVKDIRNYEKAHGEVLSCDIKYIEKVNVLLVE